jgi:ATP-dependent RNA helicase HelY
VRKLTIVDFPSPVVALERVRIPHSFNPRNPKHRRDLVSSLRAKGLDDSAGRSGKQRSAAADDPEIARLRAAIRAHPCHGCDDREEHARWAERVWRLRRDTDALERRMQNRTHTIARTFDRVVALLDDLGYLRRDEITAEGERLGRLYTELDLLAAECLRSGLWEGLTAPELAACVSALVYESRKPDDAGPPRLPGGRARDALAEMVRLWAKLDELEKDHALGFQREPDLGFAWAAYRWASGHRLESVLADSDLQAGDFVRWVKQLVDLLGQVADAATSGSVRSTAQSAVDRLRRGVVAYSSVG